MKKFVLLTLVALLACGGLFAFARLSISTNRQEVYEIFQNGISQGYTIPNALKQITKTNVSDFYGLWTLSAPPAPYVWNEHSIVQTDPVDDPFAGVWDDVDWSFAGGNWYLNISYNFGNPYTTPVELSSFTATLTALNDVQINWVSQSESNMIGYRVYRSDSSLEEHTILITPVLVPATNTSTQHSYSVVDNEVEIGNTYFYWLEGVESNESNFYGPVSITVQGEVPPVIPTETVLKNAYPNPFRANSSTNIGVDVKGDENGTVTIYNLQGKVVKVYDVQPGSHTITWNGTDGNGNACSSGIYLYNLKTPSTSKTNKMVIIK